MTARFAPGDPVRVWPGAKPGHVRTPDYLKGKPGRVESVLGRYPNPEDLAYGLSGEPERLLYKVGFRQDTLWPLVRGSLVVGPERVLAKAYLVEDAFGRA